MNEFDDNSDDRSRDSQLEDQLREALCPPPLNEEVEKAFIAELRSSPAHSKHTTIFFNPSLLTIAGLAAALLIGLLVLPNLKDDQRDISSAPSLETPRTLSVDINTDGAVDIADAYLLATYLENDTPPNPAYDFDGDGKVDEQDLDELTNLIVAL